MLLSQMAEACGGTLLGDDSMATVRAGIDSREVVAGGIFCALPGEHTDGHKHVPAALADGAAAALVSDLEAVAGARPVIVVDDVRAAMGRLAAAHVAELRRAGSLTVLAITGSAGKTTTKDLLAEALPGPTVATERSLNNEIGLPLTALRATRETRYLVLEMGADREGDLTYLTGLVRPDVAIVLLAGRAHLGMFGSREAIARAKGELIQGLLPDGVAVLNADDDRVRAMADIAPGEVVFFGTREGADLRATDVTVDDGGRAAFTATWTGGESARVSLGLAGEHHVFNALAAMGGALAAGVSLADAARRIDGVEPASPHRMAVSERGGMTIIDDAYNANPDSMAAALGSLVRIAAGRRTIAVLGEMKELGESASDEHARVGRRAVELGIGHTIVVGQEAAGIADAIPGGRCTPVDDVAAAGAALTERACPGDVVLFKASNGVGLWRLAEEWTP
ncbi:MAG TPA: UDP-N-acetylmuramoyl-tripeptide--D-alanyl-D-alanine ligase [Actinomycetaceae bacterium]|nr:UDP-N-acetylmuramoyl-tripeptide--D-alanyl-D-alanine ligase [Actinomycetaceae bacterium]